MGFFDDIFGGFFDFNGDGKTTWDEEWIAYKILEDIDKETRKENASYDDIPVFSDDYGLDSSDDDAYLSDTDSFDDYSWREYAEDNDYGIDPEDYETEDEYLEAIEDAAADFDDAPSVPISIPIKLNFSVEMPGLDALEAIKESDYPNKRQYNAALEKVKLEKGLIIGLDKETKKHRIEQCDFILEQHDKCIAANYLSVEFGEFLYAQAIKENFDLPIKIPDEDEQMVTPIDDLFRQLYKVDKPLMFRVWKWCVEHFVPYLKYSSDNGYNLTTNMIENGAFIDDTFMETLSDFIIKNQAFGKIVMHLSPSLDYEYGTLFAELLKKGHTELVVDMFKICAAKNIDAAHISSVINGLFAACTNYEELETMELFEKHILPLIRNISKEEITSSIAAWEEEIRDYYSYCEENCEQYEYSRSNAWRNKYKNEAEDLGLDVTNYFSEEEFLIDYNEEKYGWRETHTLEDTFGLNPCDFETEEDLIEAMEEYCEERELQAAKDYKKAEQRLATKAPTRYSQDDIVRAQADKTIYNFVGVMFPYAVHPYHYLTDDETINIDDKVIVPVGADNKEVVGRVVSVEKHRRISAPFPVEKTKYILRKYMDDNAALKKIRLISNNLCYGPCPEPNEEIEQHLTMSSDGRVWFSRYNFGFEGNHGVREKTQINIGEEKAKEILLFVKNFFKDNDTIVEATDVGSWQLVMTDENDAETIESGSLISDPFNDNNILCNFMREHLPFEGLFLFDGGYEED